MTPSKLQELLQSGATVAELTAKPPRDAGVGCAELGRGTERKRRARRPTLAAALKQANKAGIDVKGATLAADGSVSLTFGNTVSGNGASDNPWDEVLSHAADQKRPS